MDVFARVIWLSSVSSYSVLKSNLEKDVPIMLLNEEIENELPNEKTNDKCVKRIG